MTRDRGYRTVSAALLILAACTPASEPDTYEADAQVLREMVAQWITDFNAADAAGLASHYMADAVGIAADGPDVEGRESMQQRNESYFEQFTATQRATVDEVQVFGDVAFIRGTWSNLVTPRASGDEVAESGKWLWICERQPDGQWQIARHISNQQP